MLVVEIVVEGGKNKAMIMIRGMRGGKSSKRRIMDITSCRTQRENAISFFRSPCLSLLIYDYCNYDANQILVYPLTLAFYIL